MIFREILSSYSFRFGVTSIVVLSLVVMFVMVIVYGIFSYNYFHEVHDGLFDELSEVSLVYDAGGVAAVSEFVEQRDSRYTVTRFGYLLVDQNLVKLAGNLPSWPKFREYGDGWLSFELGILQDDRAEGEGREFVARSLQLADGNQLLVARDYRGVLAYIRFVVGILLRGFVVTVAMGVLGAFFIAWGLQRRLDVINESIDTIMSGDLSERLEAASSSSEIEQLANNLNHMLDRIQYLMDGVKQVSDNIAHDLRTPLTRLRNHLARFEKNCSDEDSQIVRQLSVEVDDMLSTFSALLRIARIEMGESRGKNSSLQLDQLVKDVVELYEPVAAENNLSLEVDLSPADFFGDRNLLFQAVANVLDNAVKYAPAGSVVTVGLSTIGGEGMQQYCISISDSGQGIEAKNREKVFQRFYREESSRSLKPGNGLGLSLVSAVMMLHQAEIELQDNRPGLLVKLLFPARMPPALKS